MSGSGNRGVSPERIDPAACHMWNVHPEGPPADVPETTEHERIAERRGRALTKVGAFDAPVLHPELFQQQSFSC